jgi:ubiquinone/menaquinone biosynthesis C-methylase UbiE
MLRQLFEPWAAELLRCADLQPGWSVLDVASGPGPVARLAATAVGLGGRVVASDISEPMLVLAAARPASAGAARIEFLACPAPEIDTPDDGFDRNPLRPARLGPVCTRPAAGTGAPDH